jgi:hypothetical protein
MNHPFTYIPGSEAWESIMPIQRGWSHDAKYAIQTAAGARLLVADAITELSACVDELQLILDEIEAEEMK